MCLKTRNIIVLNYRIEIFVLISIEQLVDIIHVFYTFDLLFDDQRIFVEINSKLFLGSST